MTEAENIAYLRKSFGIKTKNKDLLLLESVKAMLLRADDDDRRKIGELVVCFNKIHKMTDRQLLKFFDTDMERVRKFTSEEQLAEHGLYKILVTCPFLSETCELFFDSWLAASYAENPMRCQLRRIGADAFRIVSILPDGQTVEHPEDVTLQEASEYTTCPVSDLKAMPVLN